MATVALKGLGQIITYDTKSKIYVIQKQSVHIISQLTIGHNSDFQRFNTRVTTANDSANCNVNYI